MPALFALLLLGIFANTYREPELKCPALRQEVVEVWKDAAAYGITSDGQKITFKSKGAKSYVWQNNTMATVSISSAGIRVQVGTTTDKDAIEYNKRVRECQTLNGEFITK